MKTQPRYLIKFKHGDFISLRECLLNDLSKEYFAVLLGKTENIENCTIVNIIEVRFLDVSDYYGQGITYLRLNKELIYKILVELNNRYDIDTIVDVHTHPFCRTTVSFSGIDDNDEKDFFRFLNEKFDNVYYASIVLSQNEYSARIWSDEGGHILSHKALIKTQTKSENIHSSDFPCILSEEYEKATLTEDVSKFNRGVLALGLDVMRQIVSEQTISIVGVGGLGSVIAEHLVHMGFHHINLIDPDFLEFSNLNRVVGAYYEDAKNNAYKADIVKKHLKKINPEATVTAYKYDIHDKQIETVVALSDWVFVATDNHSSRFKTQQLSMKYFVPMISVGVNITVNDDYVEDMSGEIITIRVGENFCLNCLKRINPIKVAYESQVTDEVREELLKRGYVSGKNIKEPAVKTLNTIIATLAVESLVNQYSERQKHIPILVYESNKDKVIYEDRESLTLRNHDCFTCNI